MTPCVARLGLAVVVAWLAACGDTHEGATPVGGLDVVPGSSAPAGEPVELESRSFSLSLADLAGTYARGNGGSWSDRLVLEADGGARRMREGCFPSGDVALAASLDGRVLTLRAATSEAASAADDATARFVVVPWGRRTYLVDAREPSEFTRAVNAGLEPRPEAWNGTTFVELRGCATNPRGRPDLPPDLDVLVLDHALHGVTAHADEVYETWVDFGREDGVRPGMRPVLAHAWPRAEEALEIVAVEPHRSRVRFVDAAQRPVPAGLTVEIGQDLPREP
ncbi:MAG: hypothetical protein H6825_09595 [Planctomycetes bacterium]|nr:hypothetical protein [Planctomycetota bacterium]